MAIFIDKKTKVVVQGITGRDGSFHAEQMKKYGTDVVGGVTPGKGGTKIGSIPVFNTMEEAVKAAEHGCRVARRAMDIRHVRFHHTARSDEAAKADRDAG